MLQHFGVSVAHKLNFPLETYGSVPMMQFTPAQGQAQLQQAAPARAGKASGRHAANTAGRMGRSQPPASVKPDATVNQRPEKRAAAAGCARVGLRGDWRACRRVQCPPVICTNQKNHTCTYSLCVNQYVTCHCTYGLHLLLLGVMEFTSAPVPMHMHPSLMPSHGQHACVSPGHADGRLQLHDNACIKACTLGWSPPPWLWGGLYARS